MKNINNDIRERKFHIVYLLYGNEPYLKQSYKAKLREAVAGDDEMNYRYVSGKDPDLKALRDFTDTMPFFAEKRLLILEDTGLFKTSSEGFAEWIGGLPDTACVIFVEEEIDKRNRLYKKVQEKGYVCEMNHPDEETLDRWILGRIGQHKLSVTRSAFNRFREISGNEMESIRNELEKLCDYCCEKGEITSEDVDLIVTPVIESRIFQMVEAVAAGDHEHSMELYYDLIAFREPPMRILFLLERQVNQLMLVREMMAKNIRRDGIAAQLGLKPFVAGKLAEQASGFSLTELKQFLSFAVELEEAVKTGDLTDVFAVELLIHRMTGRK